MLTNIKVDAFKLKFIALVFMILDHLHTYFGFGPLWIRLTTRFVAPLFTFFIVEGFFKTSSRKNYLKRTSLFALIMFLGNTIINLVFRVSDPLTGKINFYSIMQGNNIFLTLTVFILLLMLLENIRNKQKIYISILSFIFLSIFSIFFTEGGLELYPMLFIFYFFYQNNKNITISIFVLSILRLLFTLFKFSRGTMGSNLLLSLSFSSSWAMGFVIIPILLYNNRRGRNDSFSKWLFYIVYPLHIFIFKIIALLYFFT